MKIVIATAVYYPMINGVAVFSHNLARGLAARGHEVLVLTPSQKGKPHSEMQDGVRVEYLRSETIKFYPDQIHEAKRRWLFYRHGFKISAFPEIEVRRILDDFAPDVVHVQVSDPIGLSVVAYARRRGIPVVTTEHSQPEVFTGSLNVPSVMQKPVNALLTAYFNNRQSKSDYVTMPTSRAIDAVLKGGKDLKVPVEAVSNGVDLSQFRPGKSSASLYEKYGLSRDLPTVLYVGRVDPEKNVGAVVEAFKIASVKVRGAAQLVVVGDGVDRPRLEAMCVGMSNVHFLGRVVGEDLYELYKVGDVFATASEIETQGIVLIEAAACGLPLIAVDKGAVAEVCLNGVNGFLCRPGDVAGISNAMVKILSDEELRGRFAAESLRIAREHDFEKTLDKFEKIYWTVVEKKAR